MSKTDIIIMNTTGKEAPFPAAAPNLPDHIRNAVGKTKQVSGSMKSTRSVRSLGGISIFDNPETAETLPRDLEMTVSMYEVEQDSGTGRSNGEASTSAETTTETGHVKVNGDLYATVNKTVTSSRGDDDTKSFVFTSDLAGGEREMGKKSEGVDVNGDVYTTVTKTVTTVKSSSSAGPGKFVFTNQLAGKKEIGLDTSREGKKSVPTSGSVKGTVTAKKAETSAIVNGTTDYKVTSHAEVEKRGAEGRSPDNRGVSESSVNTTKPGSAGVRKAGSFQMKAAATYGGSTQRPLSTSSSSTLPSQPDGAGSTKTGQHSVTSSVQPSRTSAVDRSSSASSVTKTKTEIVSETAAATPAAVQTGKVSREPSLSTSRPTSQLQGGTKTFYAAYGKKSIAENDADTSTVTTGKGITSRSSSLAKTDATAISTTAYKSGVARKVSATSDASVTKGASSKAPSSKTDLSRASSKASQVRSSSESVSRSSSKASGATTGAAAVERSSSKASSLASSPSSISTLKQSDSEGQRSSVAGGKVTKSQGTYYFTADVTYGSQSSLQRSASQKSDTTIKASEPPSVTSSISSLARRYSKDDIRPDDSNVSTLTAVTATSRPFSDFDAHVPKTSVTTVSKTETSLPGAEEEKQAVSTEIKSTAATTEQVKSSRSLSEHPPGSIVQNKALQAEIGALFGAGRSREEAVSAPTSLARSKQKRPLDDNQDIRLSAHYAFRESDSDQEYESQTFPRRSDGDVVTSTPTSPIYEIKQTVRAGTVDKLVKDVFWNMPLTGRSLDATLEKKPQKTAEAEGPASPPATGEDEGDGKKKYKFLVEGIDIPAPETEEIKSELVTSTSTLTAVGAENAGDQSPGVSTEPQPEEARATSPKNLEKKGFSYILDKKLASEIVSRAETVTRRRPHEKVEEAVQEHRHSRINVPESEIYQTAKAKLHKQESFAESSLSMSSNKHNEDSDLLREIKAKLNKQQRASKTAVTATTTTTTTTQVSAEGQGSHDRDQQHSLRTEVHASVNSTPVHSTGQPSFNDDMNGPKDDKKRSKQRASSAKRSTTEKSWSPAEDAAITVDINKTEAQRSNPVSPDFAHQRDHNQSASMPHADELRPSTSSDKSKTQAVTVRASSSPQEMTVADTGTALNGSASHFERSQRLVKQSRTVTTTVAAGSDSPHNQRKLQETKSDWSAESSSLVKAGGKEHRDSSYQSESREFRTVVGDEDKTTSARDSRTTEAEPHQLSQLDIINAALAPRPRHAASRTDSGLSTSKPIAKSAVVDQAQSQPLESDDLGWASLTHTKSQDGRRIKETSEDSTFSHDSANHGRSLQSEDRSRENGTGGDRSQLSHHSVRRDSPPQIVVSTPVSPTQSSNTHDFSTTTSRYKASAHSPGISRQGLLTTSQGPSTSPLDRSYHDTSFEEHYNSRQRGNVIPLKPLAVDVDYERHSELRTHPSVSTLERSPPSYSDRHAHNLSSTPTYPLSPSSDIFTPSTSQYSSMQSQNKKSSSFVREYREINNNESYRYDVGIENIPSPNRKFLKVDELSSSRVPRYGGRDIQVHNAINQRATTGSSLGPLDNYPNGMDVVDSYDNDLANRGGSYQVQRSQQQRLARQTHSQPINQHHRHMQYDSRQKSYNVDGRSGGGIERAHEHRGSCKRRHPAICGDRRRGSRAGRCQHGWQQLPHHGKAEPSRHSQ